MRRVRFVVGAFLTVLWTASLSAQQTTGGVHGRVTDAATQQPLSGVTVAIGAKSALTQPDGRYFLAGVPAGADSLHARLLGYGPVAQYVTVVAGEDIAVDLTMSQKAVGLAEMVVVGYGEQSAGNLTGAVTQVGSEKFNPGRVIAPAQLIQDKIPGVEVVDNNAPGGGLSIRIRGTTSVNASSEPLYVIDGQPINGAAGRGPGGISINGQDPLNALNANDIESITVLRDASSAAIYGTNAASGVVLITTKSGKSGTHFEYSGSMSGSSIDRIPQMLNAAQFRTAAAYYDSVNATNVSSQLGNANTDWYSQIDRSAFGQDHNFAFSGVEPATNWRLSVGYTNQEGVIQASSVERLTLGFNLQQRLFNDRLDLKANLKGSREDDSFAPNGMLSNAAQMGPTQPIYCDTCVSGYANNTGYPSPSNPVELLHWATDKSTTYRSFGNVQADYRMPFLESLRAVLNMGFDVARGNEATFYPTFLNDQLHNNHGTQFLQNPSSQQGSLETYLNYAAPLGFVAGTIDLTGGYSYLTAHAEFPSYTGTNLATNVFGPNGIAPTLVAPNLPGQSIQESKLISFFGRATYNLNDRYIVAGSLRRDGSSRFGPDNAWSYFPSISGAWRLSEENFMKGVSWVSDLKFRASWAKTGNQNFDNYQQYPTYQASNGGAEVQFGNTFVPTIRPGAYDSQIKWETTSSTNFGLDFGIMDNKITGAIDVYNKNTDDLLFFLPAAGGTNLSNYAWTNVGSVNNKGFELSLGWKALQGGGNSLGWTLDFTGAHNKNEVTQVNPSLGTTQIPVNGIAGGVGTTIGVIEKGQPINSFFTCAQYYQGGKPVENVYYNAAGTDTVSGCTSNKRASHDPAPKWILTHTSYLTFGKFDASFTLRAYMGNYVYNNVASNLGSYAELGRGSPFNLNTSVLSTGFLQPHYLSDYYVEDASFLRMDNIQIAYTFNWGSTPLRVFGNLTNAFTITGYSGVDPTAGANGIDNNIYPRARTFSAGMNIKL